MANCRGMTREEAIEYLKRADVTVGREVKTKTAEALEMAVKALEQEPILGKIKSIVAEWKTDTGTDDFSYECMIKIAEIIDKAEGEKV